MWQPPCWCDWFCSFSSVPLNAPFPLDDIPPEPACLMAPASHFGKMSHPCPPPPSSVQQKKWWHVEFKSEVCIQSRLTAPTSQKWHSRCSNLIMKVQPCLCQVEKGEERSQTSRTQDYHFLPVELIMCDFTEPWVLTIKTTRGLGGMGTNTCLLLAYFQEDGYLPPPLGSYVCLLWL